MQATGIGNRLVSRIALGGSPLGGRPAVYGYDVSAQAAVTAVRTALDRGITLLDTAPGYGDGESERRIGRAIAEQGGLPSDVVIATKVRVPPEAVESGAETVRASLSASLARLGLERADVLYLHDPERIGFAAAMRDDGAVHALRALKAEGLVSAIGVASADVDLLLRFVRLGVFDVVLTHNRFTLVDRTASPLLDECAAAGVSVVNAAPFGGGLLARGPSAAARYAYEEAPPALVARVRAMQAACARHGIPLAAAALQFSTREPRIGSTIVGMSSASRVLATLEAAEADIPDSLWEELHRLADGWMQPRG